MRETDAGHAFAQAPLFDEVLFQTAKLLVEQVVGLMNQADRDVGNGLRRTCFDEFPVKLKRLRRLPPELPNKLRLLSQIE